MRRLQVGQDHREAETETIRERKRAEKQARRERRGLEPIAVRKAKAESTLTADQRCYEDRNCLVALADGLGTDTLVTGTVARMGTSTVFTLKRLNLRTGSVVEAVTRRLEAQGMRTPRLVPTLDGALWASAQDRSWRLLTYVPGHSHSIATGPDLAREAGDTAWEIGRVVETPEAEPAVTFLP